MPLWLLFAGLGALGIAVVDDTASRVQKTAKSLAPALVIGSVAALVFAWKRK